MAHREVGGVREQDGPAAVDPVVEGRHVALGGLRGEVGNDVAQTEHLHTTTQYTSVTSSHAARCRHSNDRPLHDGRTVLHDCNPRSHTAWQRGLTCANTVMPQCHDDREEAHPIAGGLGVELAVRCDRDGACVSPGKVSSLRRVLSMFEKISAGGKVETERGRDGHLQHRKGRREPSAIRHDA